MIDTPETGTDPFGLTDEQRRQGEDEDRMAGFLETVRANMEAADALPDGTMVRCQVPGCGPHPIEMYR